MKTYKVDVSVRLSRAVTVGVPDDWDAAKAGQYVVDLMGSGELYLDEDVDYAERTIGDAEECGPDPQGNEPDFVTSEVTDCEPPLFDGYDFSDEEVARFAKRVKEGKRADNE